MFYAFYFKNVLYLHLYYEIELIMKYVFYAFMLLFLLAQQAKAQTTGVVMGTVKDRNTQELLFGAVIVSEDKQFRSCDLLFSFFIKFAKRLQKNDDFNLY